jgi:hypothetical protein
MNETALETDPALRDSRRFVCDVVCASILDEVFRTHPDFHEVEATLRGGYPFHLTFDEVKERREEHVQFISGKRAEQKYMARFVDAFFPYAQETLRCAFRADTLPGHASRGHRRQDLDVWLRNGGHRLLVWERNRALRGLKAEGTIRDGHRNWFRVASLPDGPTGPQDYGQFTLLSHLPSVLEQRQERRKGSAFWALELMLPPEEIAKLPVELGQALGEVLRKRAVTREEIPRSEEDDYVLLSLALLGGPADVPVEWSETAQAYHQRVLLTVGSEIAVWLGGFDQALDAMKREMMESGRAQYELEGKVGKEEDYFRTRHKLKTQESQERWREGPLVRGKPDERLRGGMVGMAEEALIRAFVVAGNRPVLEERLIEEVRRRVGGIAARPETVRMALRLMGSAGHIVWHRNEYGQDLYRREVGCPVSPHVHDPEYREKLLARLRPLVGLVKAQMEGDVRCSSHAEWHYVRRNDLEQIEAEFREVRTRITSKFHRELESLSEDAQRLAGHETVRVYVLSRVLPVNPREATPCRD